MSAANGEKVPPWLSALGVKSGEYFLDSKPRARRAMKSEFFSPAARIHICLGLATMGYQQELAVTMEAGKRIPLTPAHVCALTGIRREHFRRHMKELEALGLAECRGSTKGHIQLYSWALPRKPNRETIITARGDNLQIVCEDGGPVPELLLSTLKHLRIRSGFIAARGDIVEMHRFAQVAKEAELSLRTCVNGHRARSPYIRKKETERNIERNSSSASSAPVEAAPPLPPSPCNPEPPRTAVPAPESLPQPVALGPTHASETEQVLACLGQFGHPDPDAARQMLAKCRQFAPGADVDAICYFIQLKGPQAVDARNPMGLLLTAVPVCFEGDWRTLPPRPRLHAAEDPKTRRDRQEYEHQLDLMNAMERAKEAAK